MSPHEDAASEPVRRAVSAILRYGIDGPRPVDELDELDERRGQLAPALAAELRAADARRLPAVIHLVGLVREPEVLDVVAELAFESPADLEAKERALVAYGACGRTPPGEVEERLREARTLAGRAAEADPQALEAVLSWPDAWRLATLEAWLEDAGEGAIPLVGRLLGSSSDADLLLLDWLGDRKDVAAAELAAAHAARADDRDVAKAAKRALHRLRSRGIEVDEPRRERDGGFTLAVEGEALGESRAWWTSHDGRGARVVWVLWPSGSGGSRLLQVVVGEEGVEEAEVQAVTRNDVRRYVDRLEQNPSLLMERIDPARAASVLERAARRSEERGEELPEAYREWRRTAPPAPSMDEEPAPIYEHLAEDDVRDAPGLIEEAVELLREPFLSSWAINGPVVEQAAERIRQAEQSDLLVDDEQRREQMQNAIRSAVEEAFDDDVRRRYRRRLEGLAGMLWRQERRDAARRLLAAAVGLTEMTELFARHAFARALVHRGVWLAYNERREREAASESRIVRPW